MRTFQSRALALSRCSLEVVLPSAHVFLPSKEVYESLYNRWGCRPAGGWAGLGLPHCHHPPACFRINNDLLMWEPADLLPAPAPATHPPGFPGPSGFWHDNFKMCKSAFKLGRRGARQGSGAPRAGQGWGSLPRSPAHSAPRSHSRLRLGRRRCPFLLSGSVRRPPGPRPRVLEPSLPEYLLDTGDSAEGSDHSPL